MNREKRFNKDVKGSALLLFCFILVILVILGGALLITTITEKDLTQHHLIQAQLLYLAEGALEDAIYQLSRAIVNNPIKPNSLSGQTTWSDTNIQTTYEIIILREQGDFYEGNNPNGTYSYYQDYKIGVLATHPKYPDMQKRLIQRVAVIETPVFQWLGFSDYDDASSPGPNTTVIGRIHTNGNMYLDSSLEGSVFRIISDSVTASGAIYNSNNQGERGAGLTRIKIRGLDPGVEGNWNEDNFVDMEEPVPGDPNELPLDHNNPYWLDEQYGALARWQGTVEDGVAPIDVEVNQNVLEPTGYYAEQADLKIETINGCKIVTRYNLEHDEIEAQYNSCNPQTWPSVLDDIITDEDFYNTREGRHGNGEIYVTEIDVGNLQDVDVPICEGCRTIKLFPPNGLIYVNRDDSTENYPNGVRLKNGDILNNGLTLVSPVPAYIWGDYNIDIDGDGSDRKPASVIADAIYFLSNNWLDANSSGNLDSRQATSTTYNVATLQGYQVFEPCVQNGRNLCGFSGGGLLEDWGDIDGAGHLEDPDIFRTLTSGVSAFLCQISTAPKDYSGAPVYLPPERIIEYDTRFDDPDNLPPYAPRTLEIKKIGWREK